jgi:hypothetical protein
MLLARLNLLLKVFRALSRHNHFWKAAALGLAALSLALALTAVAQKSVTVDEFQALPTGLAVLQTGDFRYPRGTPPLSMLFPAVPAFLSGARIVPVEGISANLAVAQQFARDHAARFHELFWRGRVISSLFLLLALFFTYALAAWLYGERGGVLALFLVCLNPNMLAHGPLVTPDIYLTAFTMGCLFFLDRCLSRPSLPDALALGLMLGLAALSKLVGLLLFPLAILALLFWKEGKGKRLLPAVVALGTALFVVHLGYFFQECFRPIRELEAHASAAGHALAFLPGWLPSPFPLQFLRAIDQQLSEPPYQAYLLGQLNYESFFSYYLVALLVKSPIPLLLLPLLAWAARPKMGAREWGMIAFFAFFLLFFSLARFKNIGVRYLLFLYPVMAVFSARLVAEGARKSPRRLALGLCALLPLSAAFAWPSYLAYFNLPSGGPASGHRYLLDSNLDWGQDLTTLKDFMKEKGISGISLAHFGPVSPVLYGIDFEPLLGPPRHRYVAISANFLWGRSYFMNGTPFYPESVEAYAPFRSLPPAAVLGHSLYVFDMEELKRSSR